jgi:hypothetical protein
MHESYTTEPIETVRSELIPERTTADHGNKQSYRQSLLSPFQGF